LRQKLVVAFGATWLVVVAATAAPAHVATEPEHGCNVRLKGLKMLSDPQRTLVNLRAKNTTLAAISALPQPHPTPRTRSTAFSRRVWRVTAQIVKFKGEGDGDIHLILFDGGTYGIAEMPAARCLPKKARARRAMIAARKTFTSDCGLPTDNWKELGAVVSIAGVGFFDIPHTQNPHAVNFAELHPVTGFKVVAGC